MTTEKNKLKDLLNRTVIPIADQSLHISEYLRMLRNDMNDIIAVLREEYGIEAEVTELMVDICRVDGVNATTKQKESTFHLLIKPSQTLLKKFEKDYPQLLV